MLVMLRTFLLPVCTYALSHPVTTCLAVNHNPRFDMENAEPTDEARSVFCCIVPTLGS